MPKPFKIDEKSMVLDEITPKLDLIFSDNTSLDEYQNKTVFLPKLQERDRNK